MVVSVSLDLPQVVDVSALSNLSFFFVLSVVIEMCLLYVSLGSSVSPSIFGCVTVGSNVLSIRPGQIGRAHV